MSEKNWFLARQGKKRGPYSEAEISDLIIEGHVEKNDFVFNAGMQDWVEIGTLSQFSSSFNSIVSVDLPPVPYGGVTKSSIAHEIDFEIFGEEMQFIEIELDPNESVIAEAGAMMYMTDGITMETIFGDGSEKEGTGFMGKLIGAGKRVITGESLFTTLFTNKASGKHHVAFASPYPGKIIPMNLPDLGGEIICQKDAFLCAAKGVSVGIAFQKKIGVALFGGEGFIMQKLSGDGLAFVHAGGTIIEKELMPGEVLKLDTGCLVALEKNVKYDIGFVGGIKNAVFGGEGLFLATLTGPGKVWLQSLPFSRLAGRIISSAPQTSGGGKGEGSVIGKFGSLFESD